MTRQRTLTLLVVVAHWIVAVWHLFVAASVLPAPNNQVSWLAITFITAGHLVVSIVLWKLGDKISGLVSLIFGSMHLTQSNSAPGQVHVPKAMSIRTVF